ncbi:meiosis-specific protein ASY1-like isoform X2 [Tribolium madens]|uniref:meiosis-specific protein ASY1-like isoform X2 n=1 Tax=Tribolium madens TaxID=41895 RepID=UPI001CF72AFD|nr:meiosis-specific protein ASY1-like isoform X2 [Tribolium madens]
MTTTRVKGNVISLTLTNSNVAQAVRSYTMSKRYINIMLKASVINILYHRLNIDEKEFITKSFNNVNFKSFKSKSKNRFIREFHAYMIACKDALDKNYLKEFYLYFIDVSSGDIVENYKFSFKYAEKDERKQVQSADLTDCTCELLKTLEELGQHEKLNREIQFKVEFLYYEDTPEDYEPPGFRNIDESEALMSKINKKGNSVVIGSLFTGFHQLKCRGRGEVFNFNLTPKSLGENDFELHLVDEKNTESSMTVAVGEMTEDLSEPLENSKFDKPNPVDNRINDTYISHISECIDNCVLDNIKCTICKVIYHAPCQGYLDKSFVGGLFQCVNCREEINSVADPSNIQQTSRLYKVRFLVAAMYKYGRVPESLQKPVFDQIKQNIEKFNLFTNEGNEFVINNLNALKSLFKFHHKQPELRKQIQFSC